MLNQLRKLMTPTQLKELATDGLKLRNELPSVNGLRRLATHVAKKMTGTWGSRLKRAWALVYTWVKLHIQGREFLSDLADNWLYPELTRMKQLCKRAQAFLDALWEQVQRGFYSIEDYRKIESTYTWS